MNYNNYNVSTDTLIEYFSSPNDNKDINDTDQDNINKENKTKDIKKYENKNEENKNNNEYIINIDDKSDLKNGASKPKLKQSNVELLRIIIMILIVFHHFSIHQDFEIDNDKISVNRLWIQLLSIGGKISINTYILISGYFLVQSKEVRINNLIRLELQLMTYSILGYFIGVATNMETLEYQKFKQHIFPVTYNKWWFATPYVILYLLFPIINAAVHALNKVIYRNYLILLTMIWCVIPTLLLLEVLSYGTNELIWFAYLYVIGAYLRKYSVGENTKALPWIGIALAIYLLNFIFAILCDAFGLSYELLFDNVFEMTKIPVVLAAISLLIGFTKINISSRYINYVSTTTFGIYLIHGDPYISRLIWKNVYQNYQYQNNNLLIPYSILSVITIFILCSLIESLRISTIERFYMKYVDALSLKIDDFIKKMNNFKFIKKL